MKATTKIGTDSQGRKWAVVLTGEGNIELNPIEHDTDPDSDDLSKADELALFALVENLAPRLDDSADDAWALAYDRARDLSEDMRLGVL